jgi:hypothetical protein|tara:strand:+ start:267 stop:470 length:204 start_codon:yes stop_codon:yes gene_type:complete
MLNLNLNLPDWEDFPNLNYKEFDDVVNFFIFAMVEMGGGLKVISKAGSSMMSQQEIHPTSQSHQCLR